LEKKYLRVSMKSEAYYRYLPVLYLALVLIVSLFVLTIHLSFRLDTDYNVVLPMAQFAIDAFRQPEKFLTWNPYIGLGMPVLGDPSSLVLSPWYMPIFLLLGADWGMRAIIALSIIVSGWSMWMFLCSLKLNPKIVAWGAMLYETSGALTANIADGHIERFAAYAVSPIAFWCMWRVHMQYIHRMLLGLLLACMVLSVNIYTPWFLSLFFLGISLYSVFTKQKSMKEFALDTCVIYGTFIIFSLPKLIPFMRDVLPYLDRRAHIDAFMGSIHGFLLPLSYIIPWQVMFYDRPTLQRILDFRFNWYEYYAFISPVVFLLLINVRRITQKIQLRWVITLLVIAFFYISLKHPYSPFYWLFHIFPALQAFRVPQRIVVPFLVPLIVLLAYCADAWIRDKKSNKTWLWIILVTSIMWTSSIMFVTTRQSFVPARTTEKFIAEELRRRDSGNFYVVNFNCCMQPALQSVSIPILNYYYGWVPSYGIRFTVDSKGVYDVSKLTYVKPSYIIAPKKDAFDSYGFMRYFDKDTIQVWKANEPTIFPTL
jgi:uncharacterized membrane protein YhdT